jgi:hypothetical protein
MKMLTTALALGAFIAGAAFVQSADAQRSNDRVDARTRAIQECMALNKKENHDPYSATGGVQHHYRACMAEHGQFE